jgi:hypothetical protein
MACFSQPPAPDNATRQMVQEHGLAYTLSDAAGWYQLALQKRYNANQLAEMKMHADERVASVGMGHREAARMRVLNSVRGPDVPDDNGELSEASQKAYSQAKTAYQTWISGKSPTQQAAAKKLYAAWMTYMDALTATTGSPLQIDSDNPVAANAYHQAVNEFKVDSI